MEDYHDHTETDAGRKAARIAAMDTGHHANDARGYRKAPDARRTDRIQYAQADCAICREDEQRECEDPVLPRA